ncbi:MAG: hypothetical protein JOZ32_03615 [Bryobacterales bacterium]|nr:hypothetical protein [Bryobacterales bacterium]
MSGRALLPFLPPLSSLPGITISISRQAVVVTNCGRLCLYCKKINLSTCLAGQAVGIKEVHDGIWLVSFMDYDLGYIDLEEKPLQPLNNPLRAKTVTYVS